MRPAIEPGDWLLVDPTTDRWPRRGSVVVFREPDSDELAIKRIAAGPGDRVPYADGYLILGDRRGVAVVRRARCRADGGRARPADQFATVRPGPRWLARRPDLVPLWSDRASRAHRAVRGQSRLTRRAILSR